jgi:hypothetical protein
MKKGDTVFYSTGSAVIRARVRTRHRDGSVTVTALFYLSDGEDVPGYLGFRYRIYAEDLFPTAEEVRRRQMDERAVA